MTVTTAETDPNTGRPPCPRCGNATPAAGTEAGRER